MNEDRGSREPDGSASAVKLLFVAWAKTPGRSLEIAGALGGEAFCHFPEFSKRSYVGTSLRYTRSFVATILQLMRRRPETVIVSNPPIFAGIAVAIYCVSTRTPFLLDSHPASFGAKGRSVYARLEPVHKWLARRSRGVLTASEGFAAKVESWGANGIVVHEAPTQWTVEPDANPLFTALFVCIFASDEPYEDVIAAAGLLPDVQFVVTGDVSRIGGIPKNAPDNIDFCGFVDQEEYRKRLAGADVVLSLTTEPGSVMRSAYEAVYAHKPVIVSDWPNLHCVFGHAVHVDNSAASIAAGIEQVRSTDAAVRAKSARAAYDEQICRWYAQLDSIKKALR